MAQEGFLPWKGQIIVFHRRVHKGARPGYTAYPTVHMGWRVGDTMEAQETILKTGTSTVGTVSYTHLRAHET